MVLSQHLSQSFPLFTRRIVLRNGADNLLYLYLIYVSQPQSLTFDVFGATTKFILNIYLAEDVRKALFSSNAHLQLLIKCWANGRAANNCRWWHTCDLHVEKHGRVGRCCTFVDTSLAWVKVGQHQFTPISTRVGLVRRRRISRLLQSTQQCPIQVPLVDLEGK